MNLQLVAFALMLATPNAHALTDAQLRQIVDQRLLGDRTGACLAVARIDGQAVARTYACADPKQALRIGADSAFEIGSVSKTMTAALLADLIQQGKASLDDPLSGYFPEGTRVPAFEGQPILLRHIVTHTSGLPALPSRMGTTDLIDPYAKLDEALLLASLADVELSRAPGKQFEYSNFASMLLSYAVARRAGADFETLLRDRLFEPLGMRGAYINRQPATVRATPGHTPNTRQTSAWHFSTNLAGVGGVRATLDDMVRYVQAQLGQTQAPIGAALRLTQQRLSEQPPMAMNWMLAPIAGNTVHAHEGGTGGFSSFVSFDVDKQRGVVILSDTSWSSIDGPGSLGLHLQEPSLPLGKPRKAVPAPAELLDKLAGEYQIAGGLKMKLQRRRDALVIHPQGQAEYTMGYDDAGDFYPLEFDAVLRPQRKAEGSYLFTWRQSGAVLPATRMGAPKKAAFAPSAAVLKDYPGEYPLKPGFVLTISERDGQLFAQATGQGAFPLDAVEKDAFEAAAYGIELRFERGDNGKVAGLILRQAGQTLRGQRQ
jgi:serine-type D-Ala-D-Ala carboxypeptidase/endopeptidase